jgi:hypothetical protein
MRNVYDLKQDFIVKMAFKVITSKVNDGKTSCGFVSILLGTSKQQNIKLYGKKESFFALQD